jgi:Fanconi anemia group M protein
MGIRWPKKKKSFYNDNWRIKLANMEFLKLDSIEKREYQLAIAETASKKNTLVVLPTGMGKTLIGLFVTAKRLQQFPDSKIIIMAPTRPLSAQQKKTFEKFTNLDK